MLVEYSIIHVILITMKFMIYNNLKYILFGNIIRMNNIRIIVQTMNQIIKKLKVNVN